MIPAHVRSLFWDVNVDGFGPRAYPRYTIARILEWGDERACAWLKDVFSEEEIVAPGERSKKLGA